MKKQNIKIFYFLLSLILFIQLNAFAQTAEESLYKRLGGVYNIAAVVDDFIDRLLSDPLIIANQNIVSAIGKITKPGLKYQLTEWFCQTAGGPQKYNGRSMKEAHQGLNISEAQWQAMIRDFLATLAKFNIKTLDQNELIVIVGGTKNDIVIPQVVQPQVPVIPTPPNPVAPSQPQPSALPAIPNPVKAPLPQIPAIPTPPNPTAVTPEIPSLPAFPVNQIPVQPQPDVVPQDQPKNDTQAPEPQAETPPDSPMLPSDGPPPRNIDNGLPPEPVLEPAD